MHASGIYFVSSMLSNVVSCILVVEK